MLDVGTVDDLALDHGDKAWGDEHDHRQSPHEDSASSLTPSEEHGQRRDQDDRDLHDVIRSRDAHDWIENWHLEREHLQQEQRGEREYDYYSPYFDQPHRQRSPEGGRNAG
jgi:hypothetical protein